MSVLAQRYAGALADVAVADKLDFAQIGGQLGDFLAAYQESRELRELLGNPSVSVEQQVRVIDAICGRIGCYRQVRNFLAVLISHHRMHALGEIVPEVLLELDRRSGVAEAEIVSARVLSAQEKTDLEARVAAIAGNSRVRAKYIQDARLLGGALIRMGSTVYDGSLRGQLDRLKQQLAQS